MSIQISLTNRQITAILSSIDFLEEGVAQSAVPFEESVYYDDIKELSKVTDKIYKAKDKK
jgi:hypothetical protein